MSPNEPVVTVENVNILAYSFNTIVVGSGAAGLNAAAYLWKHGQKNMALISEGLKRGTSRNTGSDKQTYYKLTTAGSEGDSIRAMAKTLFAGGATDGDTALVEAALSMQCFFHLVDIGVPFPHNVYGEYVGYKTDHDPFKRGASAGPLTSKFMTDCLLREVEGLGVPIFDQYQVIELLTDDKSGDESRILGVLALNLSDIDSRNNRYALFLAKNVVYATGGEAGMYKTSVYPPSQIGGTGMAFRAGARGKNLTESQFGIASVKFRWNLSGTYQQVLPRYISTNQDGSDEKEFLDDYFENPQKLLHAVFLKGYQWPFDPRKISDGGSSLVDILVHHETQNKNRRVFLDYTRNPSCAEKNGEMDFSLLDAESHSYLANSNALLPTPLKRLLHMNPAAVELYKNHGISLESEPLEIAVCAQHNNGGLAGDMWWQSNIRGLFPVGEVNGSHGVYRPGGSALNAGQTGSVRAAQYILHAGNGEPPSADETLHLAGERLRAAVLYGENALAIGRETHALAVEQEEIKRRMTKAGAHIRSSETLAVELELAKQQLERIEAGLGIAAPKQLRQLHQTRDLAVCHYVYLNAILDYIGRGGGSRGSYLIHSPTGQAAAPGLPDMFRFRLDDGCMATQIQETVFRNRNGECICEWRPVRPIPPEDNWFENVWKRYRSGEVFA